MDQQAQSVFLPNMVLMSYNLKNNRTPELRGGSLERSPFRGGYANQEFSTIGVRRRLAADGHGKGADG